MVPVGAPPDKAGAGELSICEPIAGDDGVAHAIDGITNAVMKKPIISSALLLINVVTFLAACLPAAAQQRRSYRISVTSSVFNVSPIPLQYQD